MSAAAWRARAETNSRVVSREIPAALVEHLEQFVAVNATSDSPVVREEVADARRALADIDADLAQMAAELLRWSGAERRVGDRRINAERRVLDNRRQMMPVLHEADRRASERRFNAEPVIDLAKFGRP